MENNYKIEISDVYEGPMDLLVELIKKEKIDIYDIPISLLTDKFIASLGVLNYKNLNTYLDFSLMASDLLEIKSKVILRDEQDSDDEDPREALAKRIIEYNYFKKVSKILSQYYNEGKKNLEKFPEDTSILSSSLEINYKKLNTKALLRSLSKMLAKKNFENSSKDFNIHIDKYRLEDSIVGMKKMIKENKVIHFSNIVNSEKSKGKILSYFLAILELSKMQIINISQEDKEIVIKEI